MAGIAEQFIDQVTHMPTSIDRPVAFLAIPAATLAISAYYRLRQENTDSRFALDFRGQKALLDRAIIDTTTHEAVGKKITSNHWRRIGSWAVGFVGAGIAVGSLAGGLSYETETNNSDAQTVVVLDSSLTMRGTQDMDGESRHEAVIDALNEADYDGQLGMVEFGANSEVSFNLTSKWQEGLRGLPNPDVNPNGGDIVNAIQNGNALLGKNGADTTGDMLIVSDGTVDASDRQMQVLSERLSDRGVNVQVIVPGTEEATYTPDGAEPVQAGIEPGVFNTFGTDNVTVVTNKPELKEALSGALEEGGKDRKKQPWHVLTALGTIASAAGFLKLGHKLSGKVI